MFIRKCCGYLSWPKPVDSWKLCLRKKRRETSRVAAVVSYAENEYQAEDGSRSARPCLKSCTKQNPFETRTRAHTRTHTHIHAHTRTHRHTHIHAHTHSFFLLYLFQNPSAARRRPKRADVAVCVWFVSFQVTKRGFRVSSYKTISPTLLSTNFKYPRHLSTVWPNFLPQERRYLNK